MAIELSKLNVVVPEGFTVTKEPAVEGNKVTLEVTGSAAGEGVFLAKYDGDSESITLACCQYAKLVEFGNKDTKGFRAAARVKVPAKFDSAVDPTLPTIELPLGWKLVGKALSADAKTIVYELLTPDEARTQDTLTLLYRGTTTEYKVDLLKAPNSFVSISTKATVYNVGTEFDVELTYLNDIRDVDLPNEITPSQGLKLVSVTPEVIGKKAYYTFVGETAGKASVKAIAYKGDKQNQAARMCEVTIK